MLRSELGQYKHDVATLRGDKQNLVGELSMIQNELMGIRKLLADE